MSDITIDLRTLDNEATKAQFAVQREARRQHGKSAVIAFDPVRIIHCQGHTWFSVVISWKTIITTPDGERRTYPGCTSIAV